MKHGLTLYSGRYLAFPQTFLGRTGGEYAPRPTEQEARASEIIRETFAATWKPGRDAIEHMHEITRRALEAIERDGMDAFIAKHSDKQEAA